MVLKIRLVRLSTGHGSDPVRPIGTESNQTRIEPFEPATWRANRTNWPVLSGPSSSFSFPLPHAVGTPIVTLSVVRPTTVPTLSPGASSLQQHPGAGNPIPPPVAHWKAFPTSVAPNANPVILSAAPNATSQPRPQNAANPSSPCNGKEPSHNSRSSKRCKSLLPTPRLQSPITPHPWKALPSLSLHPLP